MKHIAIILIFFYTVFFNSPMFSEPSCDIDLTKEKIYRLDITVPATFCMNSNTDPSCNFFPKKSLLQLHGLWPNYTNGYPEGKCAANECKSQSAKKGKYCKYPEPKGLYTSETWKSLSDYMAGKEKCLERHEWVKHGVCSPMNPVSYFKWALERTKEISKVFETVKDKNLEKSEVNALIEKNLPELIGAVRLSCKGNKVSSLFVLYEWGNNPGKPIKTKGGQIGFGNCPKKFSIPSFPGN